MIRNVEDLYKYFLSLINKEKTHTVTPKMFNLVINVALLNWVKGKLPLNEFVQMRIEDLNILFVDGESGGEISPAEENLFSIPDDSLYNIRARFQIEYKNSPCNNDGLSSKLKATISKSDRMSVIEDSYYLKPKDNRLYYRYQKGQVRLFTGKDSGQSESIGSKMYLDYYRYPATITYDEAGGNNSDLEFKPLQLQEIVEQAAQEFLEKNRDVRYQSYLNEQLQRNRI